MNEKEYKKSLRQFHKHSDRHILVVETDMSFSDIQKVVALSDKIRKAGNELVGLMRKNYEKVSEGTETLWCYRREKETKSTCQSAE